MELTAAERRVLGCLIEKERATPQGYPLTLNALRLACNQSTNRQPVVDYDDRTVEEALTSLREQHLTRIVYSTSNRAAKYRHVAGETLRLDDDELAVLCVLLLRGPQTVGELKARTERLATFADLVAVVATLDRLAAREDGPLARRLERQPGQKDARYVHLLGDEASPTGATVPAPAEPTFPGAPVTGIGTAPAAGVVGAAPTGTGWAPPSERPVGRGSAIGGVEEALDVDDRDVDERAAGIVNTATATQTGTQPEGEGAPAGSVLSPVGVAPTAIAASTPDGTPSVAELAAEVRRLRDQLDELRGEFDRFRSQFD